MQANTAWRSDVYPWHIETETNGTAFRSILFDKEDGSPRETAQAPVFFVDLNLDQIIDAVTAGKQEYNLKPFFYTPLTSPETVYYRHEAMQDLENRTLFEAVKSFAQKMRTMRENLTQSDKLHYKYQKERWFLDAVQIYCEAVRTLSEDLSSADLRSRGFLGLRACLVGYAGSERFTALVAETQELIAALATVKYAVIVKDNTVKVRKYDSEIDYSADVEATFEKFKQGAVKDYLVNFPNWAEMNHVEGQILDCVAQLFPEIFASLDSYRAQNGSYLDETVGAFDREIQFYISYLEFMANFKRGGLPFCYPQVSQTSKEVYDYAGFDVALAYKLLGRDAPIVSNDFFLSGQERILVVSGPNQGGKTTFARAFGQLHYLASLGCPVPGREAQLFLFDRLFTHFEKEEDIKNLHGKLQDDLVRIYEILSQATPRSVIIMNEIFNSTTLQDAIFLGKQVMARIMDLDLLCVCVTFIDELASLSAQTVSMVSTVVPDNPAQRTYKIVRRPADGLSYAISIAEKYGLTYDTLKGRMKA